ncbi:hypothetical protein HanRHA438_Chr10g0431771 [Helianthus annuus]|nr:hypothetical protein HanRHA438_Chr10g0431771 [Helianthus annuus]
MKIYPKFTPVPPKFKPKNPYFGCISSKDFDLFFSTSINFQQTKVITMFYYGKKAYWHRSLRVGKENICINMEEHNHPEIF